jgi:BirA family biotin operon repressor/biotin-[acetyl-CoA-carboxylase] ligase
MKLPDLARASEIIAARGARIGKPLHRLDETGSTNDDAKAGARAGEPHGAVWIAERQTRGRGRQGRSWLAAPGEGLTFSVLLRIACPPLRVPPLSLVVGLAVRDAIANVVGEGVGIKWPNDVLIRGKKVAGILVESALAGGRVDYVIVGIGVNVHTREFPEPIREIATSVALASARPPDRGELLGDILAGLDHDIEHAAHRGLGLVHGRLAAHDALRGRSVQSEDGTIAGIAAGIDPEGRLLVEMAGGQIAKITSGEMRLI